MITNLSNIQIAEFLRGEANVVDDFDIPRDDPVLQSLIKEHATDIETQHILEYLIPDLVKLFRHLLQDQLPGGENLDLPTDSQDCSSVIPHNKLPERVFGQLDQILRTKPSSNINTVESTILYRHNRVGAWIASKPESEWHELLKRATSLRRTSLQLFRERQRAIREQKQLALRQKEILMQQTKAKRLAKQQAETKDIVHHGLWQDPKELKSTLATYPSNRQKLDALKAQLRFRKNVLQQTTSDKTIYSFSVNKRALSVEELTSNLTTLLHAANEHSTTTTDNISLTYHRVTHKFEEDGGLTWYEGRVVSQVPGYPQWYNIVYSCEPGTVYTYKLEEDLSNGDLKVISSNTPE